MFVFYSPPPLFHFILSMELVGGSKVMKCACVGLWIQ